MDRVDSETSVTEVLAEVQAVGRRRGARWVWLVVGMGMDQADYRKGASGMGCTRTLVAGIGADQGDSPRIADGGEDWLEWE